MSEHTTFSNPQEQFSWNLEEIKDQIVSEVSSGGNNKRNISDEVVQDSERVCSRVTAEGFHSQPADVERQKKVKDGRLQQQPVVTHGSVMSLCVCVCVCSCVGGGGGGDGGGGGSSWGLGDVCVCVCV